MITDASSGIDHKLAVQLAARAKALVLAAWRAGRLDELKARLLDLGALHLPERHCAVDASSGD